MTVARTFRFPGGSMILYSHPDGTGEIILYSKKKIDFKVFDNFEALEKQFDKLVENIENGFVETVKLELGSIVFKQINKIKGG